MQNIQTVQVFDRTDELLHNSMNEFTVGLVPVHKLQHVASLTQLGDYIVVELVLVDVIKLDDMRVVQSFEYFELINQINFLLISHLLFTDFFNSPNFPLLYWSGLVYHSIASLADLFLQFVVLVDGFSLDDYKLFWINLNH